MNELEAYYNKFNEDGRLRTRHGQVERTTCMLYIHRYLDRLKKPPGEIKILDVGAGTGAYAVPLSQEGYQVTAVEPVKNNLGRLRQKGSAVSAVLGDARNLSRFSAERFDLILCFGPLYHLMEEEEQKEALLQCRSLLQPNGYLLNAYLMNEYCVLVHGFIHRHVTEALSQGQLDEDWHCTKTANPLYHMMRLFDIDRLNAAAGLRRVQIISADGPANYMRRELSALSLEEFDAFMRYHLSTCERPELLGAGAHTLDIVQKDDGPPAGLSGA